MLEEITFTFEINISRVRELLRLYQSVGVSSGRRANHKVDILRASVVFLHSTLEDYLRSIMAWKLPDASQNVINRIPIPEKPKSEKFQLGDLIIHKGKSVDELISHSIIEYLNGKSFNNKLELISSLENINIHLPDAFRNKYLEMIDEMMKRRHNIVHQSDRDRSVPERLMYKSLNAKTVLKWIKCIDKLVFTVNNTLREGVE